MYVYTCIYVPSVAGSPGDSVQVEEQRVIHSSSRPLPKLKVEANVKNIRVAVVEDVQNPQALTLKVGELSQFVCVCVLYRMYCVLLYSIHIELAHHAIHCTIHMQVYTMRHRL